MNTNSFFITKLTGISIAAAILASVATTTAWSTTTFKTLHVFGGTDGEHPNGGLIFDRAGNLYGTTSEGGAHGYGNVFELTPGGNGQWTLTVLHDFNATDGANPEASLIFDRTGNLYGTTAHGGAFANGTVFQLTPGTHGEWTETVLHSFNGLDGAYPYGSVTFDAQGNLYGTTYQGGIHNQHCYYGCGTVFEVSPGAQGWTGKAIYSFKGSDGASPFCNVTFDQAGNLYGTTNGDFDNNVGTVFKLTPSDTGRWTLSLLHTFNGSDGDAPYAGVIFDRAGNLYGTTWVGGPASAGTVFELSPADNGTWTHTVLHTFDGQDGSFVYAGVVFDRAGNLWGSSSGYGSDLGSAYELAPNGSGTWNITVLHTFDDIAVNGGVILDRAGNLYGTTSQGGSSGCEGEGCGTIYEVIP